MDWLWMLLVAVRALSSSPDDQWAVRLAALDDVREQAFASADTSLLRDVYVDGSAAERVDAGLIASYGRRGGRVEGAGLRVLDCRVLRPGRDRVRLEVVDRLDPARVVWDDGTSTDLPHDRPTRRTITLVRTDAGWRIAATRQARGGG